MADLESALLDLIGARTGRRDLAFARRPESVTGGYWAEIFFFSLADPPRGFAGELVLRRMPDTPRSRVEIAVHRAVAELGFPTPRVRAAGSDELLGRAFLIMDRVTGATFAEVRGLTARVRRVRATPHLLSESLTRLHALPVEPLVARLRERGVDPAALSMSALLADIGAQIRALGASELLHALEWLERNRPLERRIALCHGDVHPNNLIVDAEGCWTLIDWTNARLAEPELDVGFTAELLELAPIDVPRAVRLLVRLGMRHASRRTQAAYAASAALDPQRVTWYQALYRLQILARVEAARAALPDAPPFPSSHPWRSIAPLAAERLRDAVRS